ncbi:hypothetical protein QUA21_08080 [Microcoleus sp. Pol1B3]|uniref:hypothetical protein n=1 Tax=Microcoleus sp. Pol1B3 TaxID=3055405 RepID=UPI002FD1D2E5
MSFYAIAHQLVGAVTGQIPPRRRSRKKFMLVALSLLAVRNLLLWTQRCSKIRLKLAIASPLSKSAEIALYPSQVIAIALM